ncbi:MULTISPECIES: universal stress protein [Halobacillus]|uniref:UspA domain protein n=1 Tax=Halobacillus halophilus (strain ATCC 35676 / DSM 2266 / JCM 20832 / KCTC 3685 / LMG 17431 / NBRC 102448 / NCIMB 2269) TaxID=866895 RepID=I0JKX0_HALH3|nr:universal stress protein [Halobacillus halophilus]ASF38914.1 universal stress protein [Halobacillus halophilus]CCG44790.1 UspA domain protein [Halobacillus halophilus DSM 2266]
MFKNILLATDGSDHSRRAIDQTLKMVSPHKEEVHIDLVYVVDGETSKQDVLNYGDSHTATKKRKEKFLDVIKYVESAGVSTKFLMLHGDPAEEMIEYANQEDYDCVVIGSRGRNKWQTLILGSVSHKLVKYVQSPVIVVK